MQIHQSKALADYLGQNWADFLAFIEENHEIDEAEAEDIIHELEHGK